MKISVIIPCFNVENYIKDCLNSVVKQTHPDIEIICINDGSEDATKKHIVEFLEYNDCNLRVIDQPNKGAANARNVGLKFAEGEYIQFLDADDTINPEKLRHQIALINATEIKPDIVIGNYILKTSKGDKEIKSYEKRPVHALFCKNLGVTSANLWRKEILDRVGGFDEDLKSSQEYDLMFRIIKAGGEIAYDSATLTYKKDRNFGSISVTDKKNNRIRFIQLQLRILDYLKSKNKLDSDFEDYIYHKLLYEIRLLHEHDPQKSYQMYKDHIPSSFKLKGSNEISRKYALAYELFGFQITQKLWNFYFRILKPENRVTSKY